MSNKLSGKGQSNGGVSSEKKSIGSRSPHSSYANKNVAKFKKMKGSYHNLFK